MWKKISIQIILLLLIIFLIFFAYKTYFKSKENVDIKKINKSELETTNNSNDIKFDKVDEDSNLIKNLKYISKDVLGNKYIITSKYSEINLENANMINMIDVNAKITMLNKEPIFVTSKYATYNNVNYETIFF